MTSTVIAVLLLLQAAPADLAREARALLQQGEAAKAEQALEEALRQDPSYAPALRELARLQAAGKRYPQAIDSYQRLLRIVPGDVNALSHLAEVYAWSGSHDKAIAAYQEALAKDAGSLELRNGQAQVLRWMRRYEEAADIYRAVLAQDSRNRHALLGLAISLARLGNLQEPVGLIDRALVLHPDDADLLKEKGVILAWRQEYPQAADALEKAVRIAPNHIGAQITLGDVYVWMRSYQKAIEAYKRAAALEPDNAEIRVMLARAYQRSGDNILAARHAQQAVAISPVNAQANELLQELGGRRWYSLVEQAGHLAEYLTFLFVFLLVYLNYRRSRHLLRRRHHFYHVFTHTVLPAAAILSFLLYLFEQYVTHRINIHPDVFHTLGETMVTLLLGASFLSFLYIERRPAVASPSVVLAVGAHPDDIELGCGGYLLKAKEAGARVYGLTISRGERGAEGGGDRRAEQEQAAAFVGLDGLWNLGIADTKVREHLREVIETMEQRIRETGATVVLTHSHFDVHSDHQAVFDATKEAARNVPTILCYEDVGTAKEFVPNYFVDISRYMDDKLQLVAFHRTQQGKPYMESEMIRGRAAHRGLQGGVQFAEAFRIHRIVQ